MHNFPLTTDIDDIQGTSGDDTISGVLTDTNNDLTWNVADTVNGAAGTDSFNVRVISDNDGSTFAGRTTESVEQFYFDHIDGSIANAETSTVNASGLSGATQVWAKGGRTDADNSDTLAFTELADGVTIGVADNDENLTVDFAFVTGATSGTDDSVTLAAGGGATGTVDLGGEAFETLNIATSGSANTISTLTTDNATATVNVTGDQALTVTNEINDNVDTFDASGNSGAVTAAFVADTDLAATGGSGSSDAATVRFDASVTGSMAVAGFETVNLYADTNVTVDAGLITGADTETITSDGANGDVITLQNETGSGFIWRGDGEDGAQTFNGLDYQLEDASGTSDSFTATIDNNGTSTGTGNGATIGALTLAGIESVTVSTSDFDSVTSGALTAGDATSLTVNAGVDTTLDIAGGDLSSVETIDLSGSTADVDLGTLDATGDLVLTGSGSADTVENAVVGANDSQTFDLGGGDDVYTFANINNDGTLNVNGQAGEDTFTFNETTVSANEEINLDGGADDDIVVMAGGGNDTATLDSFANIETIQFENGADELVVNVANNYADAVEVIDVSGSDVEIAVVMDSGETVDLSNYTFLGWTETTDGSNNDLIDIDGDAGNETITGTTQADVVDGGDGDDTINGGEGADFLNGNADDDTISGGAGNDTITGGAGADTLTGGAGDDVFSYVAEADSAGANVDTIEDFDGTGTDSVSFDADTAGLFSAAFTGTSLKIITAAASQQTATIANGITLGNILGGTTGYASTAAFVSALTGITDAGIGNSTSYIAFAINTAGTQLWVATAQNTGADTSIDAASVQMTIGFAGDVSGTLAAGDIVLV